VGTANKAVAHPWIPKGAKIYKVSYIDATGKLVQRTTGTDNLKDAEKLLEQWKTEVYSGKKKKTFKYSEKQVNNIIDKAEADRRIGPKKAGEVRKLPLALRRAAVEDWYKVVDGNLEYIPKSLSTHGAFPWGEVPQKFKSSKEYLDAKARVRAKIRSIKDGLDEAGLKEINKLRDSIVDIKTTEDIIRWENNFNEGYEPIRAKAAAGRIPKDWKEKAGSSINKNTDDWIRGTMKGGISRYFKKHPDVISGKVSSSTLATQFMNGLSPTELRAWDEVLRPIKLMNDRWYQVALDSGDAKYLDKIVEAHHLMPIGYEGTGLRPTNIAGAQGSGFLPSTEHGGKHSLFSKLLYKDYADLGATELYYTPEGLGDIKTKMHAPRWDAESKKVVYDLLPIDEFVHGVPEYKYDARIDPFRGAGSSDSPAHKYSIFNMWRKNPRKAAVASILVPAASLYSMVSKGDAPGLNRPKEERFLGTRRADDLWQSGKHHVFKPGGWMDWFSLIDPYDLALHGRSPRRYDTSLSLQERKMVDPTWRGTGLLETQGDKITILDRQRRKRENIWT